jgi:hypothetical protein
MSRDGNANFMSGLLYCALSLCKYYCINTVLSLSGYSEVLTGCADDNLIYVQAGFAHHHRHNHQCPYYPSLLCS